MKVKEILQRRKPRIDDWNVVTGRTEESLSKDDSQIRN